MGLPIASRLARGLEALAVADLETERVVAAMGASAAIVGDGTKVQAADVVFLCLPSSETTRSVIERLLASDVTGRTIVDTGAHPPDFVADLASLCGGRSVTYCDAPVFGTPSMAARGELYFLFSGPEAKWGEFSKLAGAVGYRTRYAGPTGTASAIKVLQNALGTANLLAGAEALRVCETARIDSRLFIDVVRECGGIGLSTVFARFAKDMAERRDSGEGRLRIAAKDARSAFELAQRYDVAVPLLETASDQYQRAAHAGRGERQFTDIVELPAPTDSGRTESPRRPNVVKS